MAKKKIAIACQGGGSQTAFTAGVLKSLYQRRVFKDYDVVSFSGTSGGAVCAALSWYSLLEKAASTVTMTMPERLDTFWRKNSTNDIWLRTIYNHTLITLLRLIDSGQICEWRLRPGSPIAQIIQWPYRLGSHSFYDFEGLLRECIQLDKVRGLKKEDIPVLLISATNVLTGEFKKFSSLNDEISIESILASAAIPSIFESVEIGNSYYWDGLYSENPPIVALTDSTYVGPGRIPDEIWVIQINPTKTDTVPDSLTKISDRQNELIGNISLQQEIDYINNHNPKPIDLFVIPMSPPLRKRLDLTSKLNRSLSFITRLMADGMTQGGLFVSNPDKFKYQ